MRMLRHLLAHIVVAVFDDQLNIAVRVQPFTHLLGDLHHFALTGFELLTVEVTHDIVHFGAIYRALDAGQMIETFIAFGFFRAFIGRHFRMNTRCQRQRVHHHPFGGAWMDVVADNFDGDRSRVEVFILQFTHAAAVYGVGPLGVKRFNVKVFRPFAHFFIWRKGHSDIAVRDVLPFQHRQRGHDFGDAGFIIGAEQGFTVGGNQRLPQQLVQHGEHHRRQHFIADTQRDIATAIVFNDLRVNVLTAKIRSSIHMGNKTNRRNVAADVRRQGAHDRPLLAYRNVHQPHRF